MGQQETTMTAATEEKGGGTLMRRTILALLVAALMAATMVASAMPAFANGTSDCAKTGGGSFRPPANANSGDHTPFLNEFPPGKHR